MPISGGGGDWEILNLPEFDQTAYEYPESAVRTTTSDIINNTEIGENESFYDETKYDQGYILTKVVLNTSEHIIIFAPAYNKSGYDYSRAPLGVYSLADNQWGMGYIAVQYDLNHDGLTTLNIKRQLYVLQGEPNTTPTFVYSKVPYVRIIPLCLLVHKKVQ